MLPKLRDKRLYWRGGVIWSCVLGPSGVRERRSTRCTTEAAAVARTNDLERRAVDPSYAAQAEATLGAAMTAYLADLDRRGSSVATKKIARQKVGHFVRLWGSDSALRRVTAKLVLDYIDARAVEGAGRYTVKRELGHLAQALKLSLYVGTFATPVEQVIPPFFRASPKQVQRYPSPEQFLALLQHLEPWRAAHLAFIAATGARLLESTRAHRADADFTARTVLIRGSKTSSSYGRVPITRLTEALLRFALERAPGKTLLFRPWGKLHRDLAAACKRAELPRWSPNDFRRAFGRWHAQAGIPIQLVSKMLRHKTDKLAQTTYANLDGADVAVLANRLLSEGDAQIVPLVYRDTSVTSDTSVNESTETAGIAARPAGLEPATHDLEGRHQNARSVGNKQAWRRRAACRHVPLVDALLEEGGEDCSATGTSSPRRLLLNGAAPDFAGAAELVPGPRPVLQPSPEGSSGSGARAGASCLEGAAPSLEALFADPELATRALGFAEPWAVAS